MPIQVWHEHDTESDFSSSIRKINKKILRTPPKKKLTSIYYNTRISISKKEKTQFLGTRTKEKKIERKKKENNGRVKWKTLCFIFILLSNKKKM